MTYLNPYPITSAQVRACHANVSGRFTEDAPRPPVPGEEDQVVFPSVHHQYSSKSDGPSATPRHSDLDLGFEPEGSSSPAPPHLRWAESLHFLLDDRDGTALFRAFLLQEGCSDLLDFWFACSGFRKLPAMHGQDGQRLKLAKAIYRKYIADSSGGVVAKKIKLATKSFIKECVSRAQLDSALFEQAQVEVQALMEEHTYPLFLKCDVYLAYARRSDADENSPRLSSTPRHEEVPLPAYLPTVMEDKEWAETTPTGNDQSGRLTQRLLMETVAHRSRASQKRPDVAEARFGVRELVSPYYLNSGFARAPVTSANESELQSLSSDAETVSLTDSSVDGIPPYRLRKQHRRIMQESLKANGQVPLPHIPRTHRLPKDVHVEPQKFATELIGRLELIQRERENQRVLEEKLHRVRLQEESEDADVSSVDQCSDDAQAILDDHLQRVMRSPGYQSPVNPALVHVDSHRYGNGRRCYSDSAGIAGRQGNMLGYRLGSIPRRSVKLSNSAGRDGRSHGCDVPEEAEQKQKVFQWIMEGERESGHYRKRLKSSRRSVCENITVAYYFCGEPIPYRTSVKGRTVTLGHFKELLTKKGSYRFYFKKVSEEFDCGVVYEEVHEDDAVLPVFEERIIGKVEKID